jgi:hypothetical protein
MPKKKIKGNRRVSDEEALGDLSGGLRPKPPEHSQVQKSTLSQLLGIGKNPK